MGLESTVICLDNSEYMRNGDYASTRLEAQQDAASLICTTRCEQNPENTVGMLAMAGSSVELLVSPTDEVTKLLAAFTHVSTNGKVNFAAGVQIAQLALKHRRNKNGGQRIIVFVGSPIETDVRALERIGKQLKKNNVAVDVISMGELEANSEKLEKFVSAANSNENSHLIVVPPGVLPSDAIISSPIIHGDAAGMMGAAAAGGGGGGAGGGGGDMSEFGVDPNVDPELFMALRMSTEQARAEEEARAKAAAAAAASGEGESKAPTEGEAAAAAPAAAEAPAPSPPPAAAEAPPMDDDEDAMLQQALALSMMDMQPPPQAAPEEAAAAPAAAAEESGEKKGEGGYLDPDFVNQLLTSVNVDQSDPLVQQAMADVQGSAAEKDSKEDDQPAKKEDK
eukprot:CAMPEP_0198422028 /NCGR_PEP_ID=MMETSP1452-20131203/2072_1 /TAXON_ID=1181717 /ORGANISM="Synchroma pusillum, Strain CCMP3072" /LENGTH=394 /DNA_ID=CAMNT_0044142277 /DNA_START=1 /DNA_END=1185 /DNA_ORIENTATION=+